MKDCGVTMILSAAGERLLCHKLEKMILTRNNAGV